MEFYLNSFFRGVGQIKEKLQQVCKSDIKQKTKNHPEGTTTWKFFCGENAKEVIVKGTAEDGEMAFTEIDQLVSSNMSKIP